MIGGNFRLDALQAAFLRVKLPHYPTYTSARRSNADTYRSALLEIPGIVSSDPAHCKCIEKQTTKLIESRARIVLPVSYPHNGHIWNQFTLRVLDGGRDRLKAYLASKGIGCEVYYPLTLDLQECFAGLPEVCRTGCEVSHQLASEVLSIPIYSELSEVQIQEVISAIRQWMESAL
jgi:dTDP-4-amino-4,6-dideoxygalactose transaminase